MVPVEDILKQEITDADGWAQEGKPVVSVLGGFLCQLMIVLNTVAKFYPQLDRPVRTNRSHASRPKSQKSEEAKSARSAGKSEGETSEVPRKILEPGVVQNFIYTFVLEKMKSEKFGLVVDGRYEKFLASLPNPLALNEMRTLKPDKYEQLRTLLSSFLGSPVLRIIKDNMQALDLDPDVFDLVYEGFWDLYTFHPQVKEISARKLQTWIQKVKLISRPEPAANEDAAEAGDDEESKDVKPQSSGRAEPDDVDSIAPVTAVVRLKIPKVLPEPELDDEGNEIVVEVNESDLEDIPFEDKCLTCVAKQGEQHIWVINHLAQKQLRQEISAEFRALNERMDGLDTQDFNFRLEKEAAAFEQAFLDLLGDTSENAKCPKVPVFDFRPKY